jgi:hypothetical protein
MNLTYPNAQFTYANGVNSAGLIAGSWVSVCNPICQYHGFILAVGGTYSDVDFPGATTTYIYGVNDLDLVVGYYTDSTGNHGWVGNPAKKQYLTVDYPGSTASVVRGITNTGRLAGWYTDTNNVTHGFLAVLQ